MEEGRGLTEASLIVRLRYVHEDMDRHGNVRVYFWRGLGHRKIRIREALGTPEFRARYDELLATATRTEPTEAVEAPSTEGSWRWLCEGYFAHSKEFKRIAERGRGVRLRILETTWAEPFVHGEPDTFASIPVPEMTVRLVKLLRDRKSDTPEAANERLKSIRQVFVWAIAEEKAEVNPARDVPYFPSDPDGFHSWTLEEIEAFNARHPIGTKGRLAKDLLLFTGARRSDVVLFGRQMIRDGWLRFTEVKGRSKLVKSREIPMLPQLQASIDATPSGHMTFLVTEFGKPFTSNGFGNWFRDRCDEAGLKECSAHGLRKAGATIAAENGATEHQLMAIFGWTSPKQAAHYTRKANRRKMAGDAMGLINFPTESSPPESEKEKA